MNNLVPVEPWHIADLVKNMREGEKLEIEAAYGISPDDAVTYSLARSLEAYAGVKDGEVYGIVGLIPPPSLLSDTACPWLLTTNKVDDDPRVLLRGTKYLIGEWSKWNLENYIDARYEKALRWAKWAGFTIEAPLPYGIRGEPFHKIYIRR